jgi:hypothetical protein
MRRASVSHTAIARAPICASGYGGSGNDGCVCVRVRVRSKKHSLSLPHAAAVLAAGQYIILIQSQGRSKTQESRGTAA